MEPVAFRDQFGVTPEVDGEGMTLNAIRLAVADIAKAEAALASAAIAAHRHAGRFVVPPYLAFGATLIFEVAKVG